MGWNAVGTSRFYVDHGLWLNSVGKFTPNSGVASLIHLNPSNIISMPHYSVGLYIPRYAEMNYMAFLGHSGGTMYPGWKDANDTDVNPGITSDINGQGYTGDDSVQYNGFSIFYITDQPDTTDYKLLAYMDEGATVGAISAGYVYSMPHSPDLKLSISYETGTKTIETRGGASLSNTMWRPPMWGDNLAAWELSIPNTTPTQKLAHSSRRIWDLTFSYLDKTNTFPKYNALNTLVSDPNASEPLQYTLQESDDFFSMVWNRTTTQNRFIFQPDQDVDEFAICKFDMNGIKFSLVANQVYTIKLKIREVW